MSESGDQRDGHGHDGDEGGGPMNDGPATRPDPVAMLRDQLARLGRGESAPEVGGVAHVVTGRRPRRPSADDDAVDAGDAGDADADAVTDGPAGEGPGEGVSGAATGSSPDAGAGSEPEPGLEADREPESEPAEPASKPASEPVREPEPEAEPEPEQVPEIGVGFEAEAGLEADRDRESASKPEPERVPKTEPEPEPKHLTESERESGPEPASEPEVKQVPGPERRSGPEAKQAPGPEPEPGPEPGSTPAKGADAASAPAPAPRPAPRRDGEPWSGPVTVPHQAAVRSAPPAPVREAVVADVASLLAVVGVPGWVARAAADALGATAAERLAADPWALLEVAGIAPEQADLFARGAAGAQPWAPDDARRVRALVLWLLRRAARRGDTAIRAEDARTALAGFGIAEPDVALRAILAEGRVMAFAASTPTAEPEVEPADPDAGADEFEEDGDDLYEEPDELNAAGGVLLALDDHALAEEAIAEAVVRLVSTAEEWPDLGTGKLERTLAANGVVLWAAGPGEEPPAAVVAAAASARAAGLRVAIVAPTADGRDRIGGDALTLAELAALERGPDGTFELDLLVVTDATLLDVGAAAAVLEAVPDGARVILAGDPAGIESAGPGRVFTDLAAGGAIRTLVAPEPPSAPLDVLADAIRDGRLPPIQDPERRVVLVPARSDEEAAHRCAQLVADSIPRVIGIAAEHVLVVSPFAAGPAGADALNAALKARMRPAGGPGVEPGDPVIAANPGPGGGVRLGTLHAVLDDGCVTVAFGRAEPEALPRAAVRPGWALTARQAMGVRRPAAVAVLPAAGADAYTRALVYTLLTRGSRHVSIVHAAGPALARAVAAEPTVQRLTHLPQALREAAG